MKRRTRVYKGGDAIAAGKQRMVDYGASIIQIIAITPDRAGLSPRLRLVTDEWHTMQQHCTCLGLNTVGQLSQSSPTPDAQEGGRGAGGQAHPDVDTSTYFRRAVPCTNTASKDITTHATRTVLVAVFVRRRAQVRTAVRTNTQQRRESGWVLRGRDNGKQHFTLRDAVSACVAASHCRLHPWAPMGETQAPHHLQITDVSKGIVAAQSINHNQAQAREGSART